MLLVTYACIFGGPAGGGATSRSFGRLKVQRVKDLVKESYRKKKQGNDLEDDQQKAESSPSHVPVVSYDGSDPFDEQEVVNVQKDGSKAFRSVIKSTGQVVSFSEFSATSSKGWGNVETINSYRSKVDGVPKKGQKLKANSDFFSRKSFKELGCSDYIIESLRTLQFVRPSHIQVCQISAKFFNPSSPTCHVHF